MLIVGRVSYPTYDQRNRIAYTLDVTGQRSRGEIQDSGSLAALIARIDAGRTVLALPQLPNASRP
ncbi:hypothetical protein [Chitinimonas koreensis]|uniref:hypothetical protein n=1 Tax=Chitinimonas koreensis TaxID=356302 RepID=UPI000405868B|nr:hypothetical protein [Chitinimonas koreensis]QNM95673.1 hypothetical protein H9L41_17705 [Chitinimonas koreensis]